MNFKAIKISVCAALASVAPSFAIAQSGLADAFCQAYMPVVEQSLYMRDQGIPIGVSKDMADSAFDTNRELWLWLNQAIELAYQDPGLVRAAISDGRMTQSCVASVRGY
ncbi:hypothetical protein [Roseobacter sp. HKCCD7870]|uniref:hypothetical protein n=1 Tax=Roseobacter sp. HKCCD7870 TaxID=3120343 RepID=UPI0030EB438D